MAAVNEIEGYLLWQSEIDQARIRAREFTAGLPWLSETERKEIERRYERERLNTAVEYLRRVRDRRDELRDEYQDRYQVLRRRYVTALLVSCCVAMSLLTLALLTA
ncbi:hypothetical protein NKH77_39330 [Streptomyces sp. M19]